MVRGILDGTKTQTRRVVKPQPTGFIGGPGVTMPDGTPAPLTPMDETVPPFGKEILCPYGQPGDRLWVREAWKAHTTFDHLPPRDIPQSHVWYMADDGYKAESRFRQGMFMPRWASRITLEVTGVRVERLGEISVGDAIAEGIPRGGPENPDGIEKREYRALWERINGEGSWDANPWVWVIEFKRLENKQ
jgi:hypothetical protein